MKFQSLIRFAFSALILGAGSVEASLITYETRQITSGVNTANYAASWALQSSAITSNSISTLNGTAPGNNSFVHVRIDFTLNPMAVIQFQIAPDAGYGGELRMNGNLIDHDASNLWWNYDFNAASELLKSGNLNLVATNYVLEAYWAEDCCSGTQAGRFSVNGSAWQELNVSNLDKLNNGTPAAVPEPGTVALFGLGLTALAYARSRRNKA